MTSLLSRVLVEIDERFQVPTYSSIRAGRWSAAYAALALPFQLVGRPRVYRVDLGGEEARAVFVGRPKRFRTLTDHWFDAVEPEGGPGPLQPLWSPGAAAGSDADLLAVEIHGWLAPRFRRAGWRIIPDAVRWSGDLAGVPPEPPSRSLRSDLTKLRRGDFALEVARSREDWDEFYHTMVVPHGEKRFGDRVWVPSTRFMRELAAIGTLLFVRSGSERIAGISVVRAGDRLWVALLGVRDGDPRFLADGALTATYAFAVERARREGCARVDFGRTSPFVNGGIQHYKRKWGLAPGRDPLAHRIAVWLRPGCEAVRRAFEREPVYEEVDEGIGESGR